MWLFLSLAIGVLVAVGMAHLGLKVIAPLQYRPVLRALLALALMACSIGMPTWVVSRLHPRFSRAHLLAYVATLTLLLVVTVALLNIDIQL